MSYTKLYNALRKTDDGFIRGLLVSWGGECCAVGAAMFGRLPKVDRLPALTRMRGDVYDRASAKFGSVAVNKLIGENDRYVPSEGPRERRQRVMAWLHAKAKLEQQARARRAAR